VRLIVVTGTGTGVGKTIATAALAACALRAGAKVAVVKPVQTGVHPGEPGDLADVQRLTGLTDLHELVRYAEPLAPATAARRLGADGPHAADLAASISALADRDLVIVEGAGGALVRFNTRGETLLDLVSDLTDRVDVRVLLVASSGLGVLNVAALTAQALARSGSSLDGVVMGDWPVAPDLAQRCNLRDLSDYAEAPIGGVLADGAGRLGRTEFTELAVRSLGPALGGTFDAPAFIAMHSAPPLTARPLNAPPPARGGAAR
jgi:dethiobiotin synthetase